jgi:hypothetical protein
MSLASDDEYLREYFRSREIRGTSGRVVVDAFRCVHQQGRPHDRVYFLSHFHSDHYTGLGPSWSAGLIYCTPITARLVVARLRVRQEYVREVAVGGPPVVLAFGGGGGGDNVMVDVLEANHCPGAAMFLFHCPDGTKHLHTGDFRFDRAWARQGNVLTQYSGRVDTLYLDNTFGEQGRHMQPQHVALQTINDQIDIVLRRGLAEHGSRRFAVVVGSYTIGKERVAASISANFRVPCYVSRDKADLLRLMNFDVGDDVFRTLPVDDVGESCVAAAFAQSGGALVAVFMSGMGNVSFPTTSSAEESGRLELWEDDVPGRALPERVGLSLTGVDHVICVVPTGWSAPKKAVTESERAARLASAPLSKFVTLRVDYSEHSSFDELKDFVSLVNPKRVEPTVSLNAFKKTEALLIESAPNLVPRFARSISSFLVPKPKIVAPSDAFGGEPVKPRNPFKRVLPTEPSHTTWRGAPLAPTIGGMPPEECCVIVSDDECGGSQGCRKRRNHAAFGTFPEAVVDASTSVRRRVEGSKRLDVECWEEVDLTTPPSSQ